MFLEYAVLCTVISSCCHSALYFSFIRKIMKASEKYRWSGLGKLSIHFHLSVHIIVLYGQNMHWGGGFPSVDSTQMLALIATLVFQN